METLVCSEYCTGFAHINFSSLRSVSQIYNLSKFSRQTNMMHTKPHSYARKIYQMQQTEHSHKHMHGLQSADTLYQTRWQLVNELNLWQSMQFELH